MKKISPSILLGIASSVVMLVLIILHFIPYWYYQGESVSLAAYLWRPYEHTAFTTVFRSYFGKGFKISLLFARPLALTLAANAVGTVLCAIKSAHRAVWLIPVISGILGLYAFLCHPAYRLSGLWLPHVILYALVLVLGILGLILAGNRK